MALQRRFSRRFWVASKVASEPACTRVGPASGPEALFSFGLFPSIRVQLPSSHLESSRLAVCHVVLSLTPAECTTSCVGIVAIALCAHL